MIQKEIFDRQKKFATEPLSEDRLKAYNERLRGATLEQTAAIFDALSAIRRFEKAGGELVLDLENLRLVFANGEETAVIADGEEALDRADELPENTGVDVPDFSKFAGTKKGEIRFAVRPSLGVRYYPAENAGTEDGDGESAS